MGQGHLPFLTNPRKRRWSCSDCDWFPPSYTQAQKDKFKACTGMQAAMDDYYRWRDALFYVDNVINVAGGYVSCLFMAINAFLDSYCKDESEAGMSQAEKLDVLDGDLFKNFDLLSTPGLWVVSKIGGLFDTITKLWRRLCYGLKVVGKLFKPAVSCVCVYVCLCLEFDLTIITFTMT